MILTAAMTVVIIDHVMISYQISIQLDLEGQRLREELGLTTVFQQLEELRRTCAGFRARVGDRLSEPDGPDDRMFEPRSPDNRMIKADRADDWLSSEVAGDSERRRDAAVCLLIALN